MKKITKLFFLAAIMLAWGSVAYAQTSDYCSTPSGHLNNPTFGDANSHISLTIENISANSIRVTVAKRATGADIDYLRVEGGTAAVEDGTDATTGISQRSVIVNFTSPGTNVTLSIMWSNPNWAGRWAINGLQVPFAATCAPVVADTEAPTAFTATKGKELSTSVELLLNATDNSGTVNYTISYGSGPTVVNTAGVSGTQKSYFVTGLAPSTEYSFSVVAKDAANNAAANNPIVVTATTTAGLTTPAPTPTVSSTQVKSIYSDAYTGAAAVTGLQLNPGWNQATVQSVVQLGSDNVLKYSNFNYQGTIFDNIFPIASGMKYLHIDIWTETETSVKVFPICWTGTANEPEKFKTLTLTPTDMGVWKSYDIPLTDFTSQGLTMQNVYQLKLEGTGGKTVYFDNIYFWTDVVPSLVVSAAVLNIAQPANSTNTFDITTTSSWTIESDQTWLTPSTTSGSGNATITLTATTANETYVARTANVTITGSGTTKTIAVTQAPLMPAAAPTPPSTLTADKVMSVYSDTYTNLPSSLENWYGNNFSTVMLAGNTTLKNVTVCCFGYLFTGGAINVSGMTKLHVDIYPLTLASMSLGVTPGDKMKTGITLTPYQWNSVDVLLSELAEIGANLSAVEQVGFWNLNGTFYLDNLYFYNDATTNVSTVEDSNSISLYPNPIMNELTINAKSEISQVIVRNLLGQNVKSMMVNGIEKTIDLSDVSSGNYFVTVKLANGQLSTQKVVKL
jgi:hypothetical protein